jgi:ABC-type bacteriocin/lantibiotic exporter with double-glycine peptidase domain
MEGVNTISSRRQWLVPEVVQTSAMDCGPAVLKCLLAGYGIAMNYGRLREACQTDLDGTSIDALEGIAIRLGLVAEQVMLPVDQVLLPEAKALPAILIVRLPDGATHFVLVWRRYGSLLQVMDPAIGRRWISSRQLIRETYVHRQQVPADAWREWAVSDEMLSAMRRRLRQLGLAGEADRIIERATSRPGWRAVAQLDATVRLVYTLVQSGSLSRGAVARKAALTMLEKTEADTADASLVPDRFWSVRASTVAQTGDEEEPESLWLRGAVLIRISGRRTDFKPVELEIAAPVSSNEITADSPDGLNCELRTALHEPDSRPFGKVWSLVRQAGWVSLVTLFICMAVGATSVIAEALLLRSILDLRRDLAITPQRMIAIGGICLFGFGLLLLEYGSVMGLYRLGRRLELALRIEFLSKIPRLHDRYFQSRPTSDMAERGHSLHQVRLLPHSAGQFLRAGLTIALTAIAIAWLEPAAALLAVGAACVGILLPILFLPILQGLDLRVRTHAGALTRFTLDALLGLAAVRAHVAEKAIATEHESLLVEWSKASYRLLLWRVMVNGLQLCTGIGMSAFILITHASHIADATGLLLLAYWALNIPSLGDEIALVVHQYPICRNVTLRLLEPLGAPEQESLTMVPLSSVHAPAKSPIEASDDRSTTPSSPSNASSQIAFAAAAIRLEQVNVQAGGHEILSSLDVDIPPQSHVAIVGPSGAGKSSLVGLLLGWHRPAFGRVILDGKPLDGESLADLRRATVWVDPAVQIWNRSLLDNLLYGNLDTEIDMVGDAIEQADLYDVLQRLPEGLQTRLGEGGGLLSGGESQRIKFGRAIARREPRLVVLDEPFRGLERHRRHELLQRALICITHDLSETLEFPRVLVLEGGRLVEDAAPAELTARPDSLFSQLLKSEYAVRKGLWGSSVWRRIELQSARLREIAEKGSS